MISLAGLSPERHYTNTVDRSYDAAGRLTAETLSMDGTTWEVGYGYDAGGRQTQVVYPDDRVLDRGFTSRNQLASLTFDGHAHATLTYDAGGRETRRVLGNGIIEHREWTAANRMERVYAEQAGIVDFTYAYDLNQRKTLEQDGVLGAWSQSFAYDAEDRLADWNRGVVVNGAIASPLATQSWNLTLVGDWDDTTRDGVLEDRTHNDVHEITAINGAGMQHDVKGNLTVDPLSGQTYAWDEENRLTAAEDGGSTVLGTYRYDALGRRVQKTVDGVARTFVMAGAQVVSEYVAGVLDRSYVYGAYVDEPVCVVLADDSELFYHRNHLYCASGQA